MSITIINKGFGTKIYDLLNETNKTLYIISPFIGYQTAENLAKYLKDKKDEFDCKIITRFKREDFLNGASDIKGLKRLVESGAKLYALKDLHAKLYLFDNESLILGSANFTFRGLFKNHELGVFVKNEMEFAQHFLYYFNDLLSEIKDQGDFEITEQVIDNELAYYEKHKLLYHRQKADRQKDGLNSKTKVTNTFQWGAEIILDKEEAPQYFETEIFELIDESILEDSFNGRSWFKFEGSSRERVDRNAHYLTRKRSHLKNVNRTYFPPNNRPTGFEDEDIVFIGVVSKTEKGSDTVIFVGYAYATKFDKDNVTREGDTEFEEWMKDYPYYIELNNGKFIDAPIYNGITMIDLVNLLKHKLYPSTENNPSKPIGEISMIHAQKSHLQITDTARRYLKTRLDELFEIHGFTHYEYQKVSKS